jgi:hypothetical protein
VSTKRRDAQALLQPLSRSEWRVFTYLLRKTEPTLFAELQQYFGGARSVLQSKLDRCVGKGWVRAVSTGEGEAALVLERVWRQRGALGRPPGVAYEAARDLDEAARFQAERLIDEWDLAGPDDRREVVETIRRALVTRVETTER